MINRALLMRCAKAPEVCCMHDWWIALTASCFGIIEFMPRALSKYRQHGNNVLGAKDAGSFGEMKARLGRGKEGRTELPPDVKPGHCFRPPVLEGHGQGTAHDAAGHSWHCRTSQQQGG